MRVVRAMLFRLWGCEAGRWGSVLVSGGTRRLRWCPGAADSTIRQAACGLMTRVVAIVPDAGSSAVRFRLDDSGATSTAAQGRSLVGFRQHLLALISLSWSRVVKRRVGDGLDPAPKARAGMDVIRNTLGNSASRRHNSAVDAREGKDFDEYFRVRARAASAGGVRAHHRSLHVSQPCSVLTRSRVWSRRVRIRGQGGAESSANGAPPTGRDDRPERKSASVPAYRRRHRCAHRARFDVAGAGSCRAVHGHRTVTGTAGARCPSARRSDTGAYDHRVDIFASGHGRPWCSARCARSSRRFGRP